MWLYCGDMVIRWVGCFVKVVSKWVVIGLISLLRVRLNYKVLNKICGYKKNKLL